MLDVTINGILDACEEHLLDGGDEEARLPYLAFWSERFPAIKKSLQDSARKNSREHPDRADWCMRSIERIDAIVAATQEPSAASKLRFLLFQY